MPRERVDKRVPHHDARRSARPPAPERQEPPGSGVLRLQPLAGNRAVAGLLRGTPSQGRVSEPPVLARQPIGGTAAAEPPADIPRRYAGLLQPSLDEAGRKTLRGAVGGADLADKIIQRDQYRTTLAELERVINQGAGHTGPAMEDYGRIQTAEQELTTEINAGLAKLGVSDERALLRLLDQEFPSMFLREAKAVAYGMLDDNEAEAQSERDRYSELVCSPDIDGLLAADRQLAQLDYHSIELSIKTAEQALAIYGPAAGPLDLDQLSKQIPESQGSVIVDIANLGRNRERLEKQKSIYDTARFGFARSYPILLSSGYRPGSFADAPPEDLGKLVGEPVNEILENIERVRDAIADNDLKVWNMRHVLRITQERLGVNHPVLLRAIQRKIESIEADERFLSWVKAALAITTTLLAGALFTPAAGAAVAAAWGVESLAKNIGQYRDEMAAENVALDPAVADISLNEPTLTWVVLDAVFLGLDLAPVARALRPAARALSETRSALALRAFRERASAELGDDVAEQLTRRAALRFGIEEAGQEIAEQQLRAAREILAGLGLGDDAIVRVLAKGTDLNQVKGQLFEELAHRDVARRLAAGGDDVLGIADTAGAEVIQGHRITDLAGLQLTDGMIVRRQADGVLEVATVIEAKAGRSASEGLRRTSSGIGDPEEFARFVIEQERDRVVGVLRSAGLHADAQAVAAGRTAVSDAAVEAIAANKGLRRTVTQAELGGQVRKDIERLAPGVDEGDVVSILIDGMPTQVRLSPTRTRFVGALPSDVPTAAITRDLAEEGISFAPMQVAEGAADVTSLAQRLIGLSTPAPASVPVPAP